MYIVNVSGVIIANVMPWTYANCVYVKLQAISQVVRTKNIVQYREWRNIST